MVPSPINESFERTGPLSEDRRRDLMQILIENVHAGTAPTQKDEYSEPLELEMVAELPPDPKEAAQAAEIRRQEWLKEERLIAA